jgi:hypothetical protein
VLGAFASIDAVVVGLTKFNMHRDVAALGWQINDEIYITHFAYRPYLQFGTTPPGINYRLLYSSHRSLGNIPRIVNTFKSRIKASRTTTKTIPLLSAIPPGMISAFAVLGGPPMCWQAAVGAGGPTDYLYIPIVPAVGTILKAITIRAWCDVALTTDSTMSFRYAEWDGTQHVIAGPTSFDCNGAIIDVASAFTHIADATYYYFLVVSTGFQAGASVFQLLNCKLQYNYLEDTPHLI